MQFSLADLHSPESLQPEEDLRRMTASVAYNRPMPSGNWATLLLWGRNRSLTTGNTWQICHANNVTNKFVNGESIRNC